jgi:hypothetical protein
MIAGDPRLPHRSTLATLNCLFLTCCLHKASIGSALSRPRRGNSSTNCWSTRGADICTWLADAQTWIVEDCSELKESDRPLQSSADFSMQQIDASALQSGLIGRQSALLLQLPQTGHSPGPELALAVTGQGRMPAGVAGHLGLARAACVPSGK